ncbi:uncharacterized protein LOC119137531 [Syngnathus acus]|uniref:uncharacterized protein LOC119137531 n=1 Tax=Syngnathus acus TaxID=161584 RepID=UPI001885E6DE|nr:uncharacterized protein LOC119137531 [Syngnathus acus]
MHRGLILVVAALALLATARGTEHLTFDSSTMANVTREGCDETNLCLEDPQDCDPANATCLFASLNASMIMSPDGFNLSVALSGNSSGLIAFGLTQNFTTDVTQLFVCGIDSDNIFFFQTVMRSSDGTLTPNERNTTQIRNSLNGTLIQCEFIIPNVNTTMSGEMMDGTTSFVVLGNGDVTSNQAESFTPILNSSRVNLTNAEGIITIPDPVPPRVLNINRVGCGNSKLCIESPNDCDPMNDSGCLFTSLETTTDTTAGTFDIMVELAGESNGYVAMGLTANASEGVTNLFICGTNSSDNSSIIRRLDRNNTDNSLTEVVGGLADMDIVVTGMSIRCTFTIIGINSTASRQTVTGTQNMVLLGDGSINDGVIGNFNTIENSGTVDITNPSANIVIIPVVEMLLNISREGCGSTNLCLEMPDNCDPLTAPMCQFVAFNVSVSDANEFNMTVRLSVYSMGYGAIGLATNATQATSQIFACGNDSNTGEAFVRTFIRNTDDSLTANDRTIMNPIVEVVNRSIECQFTIINLNGVQTRETNGTIANVLLANGTLTGSTLDPLNVILTELVNLTSPTGTISNGVDGGDGGDVMNGARAQRSSDALLALLSLVTLLAMLQS